MEGTKDTDEQIVQNIYGTLEIVTKTESTSGKTCDDKRSLVHSILLCCLSSPSSQQHTKQLSLRKISKRLGLPPSSMTRIAKQLQVKRAALEGINTSNDSIVFSQVVKRKGWSKIDELLKKIIVKYIVNHPNVIHSPIMNDTILVKDPTDSSKKIKKNKLLLQTSVRKLHSDLIADVPECTSSDGKVIVSDTKLRALIPPEVKSMTLRYKQMCGCLDCLSIDMYHEAYHRFKRVVLKVLKQQLEDCPRGGATRRRLVRQIQEYDHHCQSKPKVKEMLHKLHCTTNVSPVTGEFRGLYQINCAFNWCNMCPSISMHPIEKQLLDQKMLPYIPIHTYDSIWTCSEHGVLGVGEKKCSVCEGYRDGEKKAKVYSNKKLVSKSIPFQIFLMIII